jgi:hypothetical protein
MRCRWLRFRFGLWLLLRIRVSSSSTGLSVMSRCKSVMGFDLIVTLHSENQKHAVADDAKFKSMVMR